MLHTFIFFILIKSILTDEIFKFSIEEKSPINTFIADLSREYQINTNAFYSLTELISSNKNLLSINNQTGYLTTNEILDRDQMCIKQQCSCQSCDLLFQIQIQIKQKIIYKIIEINIKDQNDHSPIFDQQSITHTIHIKENIPLGYRIILPIANDPDEGINSIQSYTINGMNSEDFDVDYSSIDIPYLIVRSSLDHQRISSYLLVLTASDNGQQPKPRSGSIQLNIQIIHNESIPIFQQSVYSIDIREDISIGTNLLKIQAISDDKNEKLAYELLTESPFIIHHLTGNIELKDSLDYEKQKSYRLTIKAFTINSIPTYAIVFIHIIDINDNPVLIHIKTEGNTTLQRMKADTDIISISEDTEIGTILAHVILNDQDSFVNGNPYLQLTTNHPPLPIKYKLIYQNNFQNLKLYSLILQTKLDRESQSIYNNTQLIAYDSGTPILHTRLFMILNITDVNDCIPQLITNSTIYNINENNPIGLIIDTLKSFDCDLGMNAEIEYNLLNETDLLIVNSQTGQLSLNQSIDFELFNHSKDLSIIDLEFIIEIKDHGQPSLSNQVKIILRIHDLNDNSPIFDSSQSYNWSFSPSILQPGSILGRIFAYDNDSSLQGIIHYSIHSFESCITLHITSIGYISILSKSSCSYTSFIFEITASDYGTPIPRSTKQLLTINIDLNSNIINPLPQLLPISSRRIIVDRNSIDNIQFILDITRNHSIQPRIYLNNTDLLNYWQISSTGEIRLISQPNLSSYLLLLNIIDEYTEENILLKLQIDICNSLRKNSCKQMKSNDDLLLLWAISLALIITCLSVLICSIIICLCCQKRQKEKKTKSNEDFQRNYKTSSFSTDDRDSACVMNTNSSSVSSGIILNLANSSQDEDIYQPSTYFYDIKLAEMIRNNSRYVNSQSLSSDYGSQISPSIISSSSNQNRFISSHECIV